MNEKRVIAIDLGEKNVGVAITDPLGLFAQPLCTISAGKREVINRLIKLIDEYSPLVVVIGLPVEMSGKEGPQAVQARAFAQQLSKRLEAISSHRPKIDFFDERLTTVQATRILHGNQARGREVKERVDQVSAAVILEGWLSAQPSG